MTKVIYIIIVLSSLFLNHSWRVHSYDFSRPVLHDILPESLHEISGLTILDSTTIACIQDENGILFLYDIKQHTIKRQYTFGLNGDYEGITRVGPSLYILRSDGVLFEIKDYRSKKLNVKTYATGVPALNNEGLCYDSDNNRLLIGAKGKINKDPLNKELRCIYAFDLKTKTLNQEPAFKFNTTDINVSAKMEGIEFLKKKNKKGENIEVGFKFHTSEIAIHPVTKQLYVLSASDHCLFIFDMNGTLEAIEQLNPVLFNKAEGLSFFDNGDLLISNEGQAHQPTLLRFNYKP
ncbi:MAG: hypothetical protein HY062_03060 [Bacteroidetes bacterium]|nr:hypothetical protein [Bacteroidota bacterium]